ncbi:MAG: P-type DNA transfer ATPase VirB11 [Sulfurovum sp.]|nr:P-type DNA transfer ATPase VirB11 [Sulfurovum sp.]
MSGVSRTLALFVNKYFREILNDDEVTEVCYNGGNKIFSLSSHGKWTTHETSLNNKTALSVVTSISSVKNTEVTEGKPILSSVLDKGERVQLVTFPATTKDVTSITIRKPNEFKISMDTYEEQNFFEITDEKNVIESELMSLFTQGKYRKFIELAVLRGKTIVVAGATGSGKTTFMKTLIDYIPHNERIISIEDVEELVFTEHQNYVQLFYPSEAKVTDFLNASTCLKSCLRMKPDRIILAELRGGETFDFINIINSGHSGSITSCHAGSVEETFNRLELMTLQNPNGQKIPYEVIQKTLKSTIDIVVHVADTQKGKRITEMYYKEYEDSQKKETA